MKRLKNIRYIFLILLPIWACSKEEAPVLNEYLVFHNAFPIKIPPYQYDSSEISFTVRGDTSFFSTYPDTLNNMPRLKWDTTGIEILTVAIFNQPIEVSNGEIINTENLVWQWHSGMEFETGGSDGDVKYSEGRSVLHDDNDTIDYQNAAQPLRSGHYFWAVWGWDPSGVWIWYSSRQLEFYVSE